MPFVPESTERLSAAPRGKGLLICSGSGFRLFKLRQTMIPVINDERTTDRYRSRPMRVLPSMPYPTAPIIKAGPALIENSANFCACSSFKSLLSKSCCTIDGPTGYPPVILDIKTPKAQLGRLNKKLVSGAKSFVAELIRPDRATKFERTKKGSRVGIRVSAQTRSDAFIDSEISFGNTTKQTVTKMVGTMSSRLRNLTRCTYILF